MGCMWSCHVSLTLGLHVTGQLHLSIFTTSAMNSSSYRRIVATTSSHLYQFGHQSALAFSGAEVLCVANYLQINVFLNLVVVDQEECPQVLQKKATRGATNKGVKKMAGQMWLGLIFETSTSISTIHHITQWRGLTAK